MKKVILTIFCSVLLLSSPILTSLAYATNQSNFVIRNNYTDGQFLDVLETDWYAPYLKTAYEYGIMTGTSENYYEPNASVTIAQVVATATRLHSIYHSGVEFVGHSSPWFLDYVEYALENHILQTTYRDYNKIATRAEFVEIIANALPANVFEPILVVPDGSIPDISTDASYYNEVILMYESGIITGMDAQGTFAPNTEVTRSVLAVVVARMIKLSLKYPALGNDVSNDYYNDTYIFAMDDSDITQAILEGQTDFSSVHQSLLNRYGVPLDHLNLVDDYMESYYYNLSRNTDVSVMTPACYITRLSALAYTNFNTLSLADAKWYYETFFADDENINIEIQAAEISYDDSASFSVGIVQNGNLISPASVSGLREYPELSSNWPDTPAYYRSVSLSLPQSSIDVTQPIKLIIRYFAGNELVYEINLLDYID